MKNKVLMGLLSFVIASGLWIYVVTVVSPESEATFYNVPVVLSNESVLNEKGLMIVSDSEPTITLRLAGNRSDLNSLKSSDITVVADLSKINEAGKQVLSYVVSYPGDFAYNAFEILSRSPDSITLDIVEWSTKEVDVTVEYSGSVPQDYIDYRSTAELDCTKITITGPKNVVDQITQAKVNVDLTGRTETFSESYRYTLCDAEGNPVDAAQVKTNIAEVNLTMKIHRVKVINLQLNVSYGAGATQETTSIVIDPAYITVAGSDKRLEEMEDTLVLDTIDLATITDQIWEKEYTISLPEGVTNLTGVESVKVTITFPNLVTKQLWISMRQAQKQNLPDGMTAEFATQRLLVTVRGTAEQIARIEALDIAIKVDFSGAELGYNNYGAAVSVSPVYSDVYVAGSYEVQANVTVKTEDAT